MQLQSGQQLRELLVRSSSRESVPSSRRKPGFAERIVPMRLTVMMPSPAVFMIAVRCIALSLARERAVTTLAMSGAICQRRIQGGRADQAHHQQQQHVQALAQVAIEHVQRRRQRNHQRCARRSGPYAAKKRAPLGSAPKVTPLLPLNARFNAPARPAVSRAMGRCRQR